MPAGGPDSSSDPLAALIDRALDAVARGEIDGPGPEADTGTTTGQPRIQDLQWVEQAEGGELRRLTLLFCDLVGSTALSGRHDPEGYRFIIGGYRRACREVVQDRYDGHLVDHQGDGFLAVFGHPTAHEDDAYRAVQAGLELVAAVRHLSARAEREIGETLSARVGVHHGLVFLDTEEGDVYGLAANVASRLHDLAPPGALVVSEEVGRLVDDRFELAEQPPAKAKGLDEPLRSWRVIGEAPAGAGRPAAPLVGRDRELDRLRRAWATRPAAVVVRGEAGVGKSRLVTDFATEVRAGGARVVELAGSAVYAFTGYHPLRALIERNCHIGRETGGADRLARVVRHLEQLGLEPDDEVPLLAPVLGLAPDAGYTPVPSDARKLHAAIAQACGRYLRAGPAGRPTLVIAEDLHWVDDATRELLDELARHLPDGMMIVTTVRPGPVALEPGAEVIELGPLPPAAGAALIAALDRAGALAGRQDELLARADGIPLYLEALVRGALSPGTGVPGPAEPGPGQVPVPEALHEPLMARLPARAVDRRIAAVAATIGRDVDRRLLAQVTGQEPRTLDHTLESLRAGSILERLGDEPGRYRFRHELVRQVAYEAQPPSARRDVHRLIADALTSSGTDATDWVVLAHHQEHADRQRAASDSHARAADDARRRGAGAEATRHLDRALALLAELPDSSGRRAREVELLLQRGFLAVSLEGNASERAAADYQRALDVAMVERSRTGVYSTLISLWGYYASGGELGRARLVLEHFRTVATGEYARLQVENDAGFAILDWFGGNFRSAVEGLEAAAAAAVQRPPERRVNAEWTLPNDPCAAIHTHLATARFMVGDPSGTADALAAAARHAEGLAFPYGPFSTLYAESYRAWLCLEGDDLDGAEASRRWSGERADAHGFDFFLATAATVEARVKATRAYRAGEPTDVLTGYARSLDECFALWMLMGARVLAPQLATTAGVAHARAGDAATARARFDEALSVADRTGLHFYDAETLRVRADLEPDPAARERALLAAADVAADQHAVPFLLRIAVDLHRLRPDAHGPRLATALAAFAPGASYPELDAARARLAR
jgi:class 3 adenylate cyclase